MGDECVWCRQTPYGKRKLKPKQSVPGQRSQLGLSDV
uniref:Uncharacterized protein n=1 Tax=Anguilla anguilla TaxID=7936 RepID=A0A0E9U1M7_ANGAN